MSISIEIIFLIIAILLILSVAASKFSERFGIPALSLFLILGMLAGSEGLGGIYFDDPIIAQGIGFFALAVILFSGGLETHWESIRGVMKESLVLATVGVSLTALILGAAAHFILGISLLEGLLIGAITSSTDAAAVFSLLRASGIRLKQNIPPILELESGTNDPMAVFLTISLIQLIQTPHQPWINLLGLFFQQMLFGGLLGILFGKLLLYMINRLRLGYEGLYPVLALGMILLTFGSATLIGGSPFLAVYLVGLTLGRSDFLHKRSLIRFYEGLAWLFQIVMFLALGLFVFPSRLVSVIVPGMILAIILIFVARPLSIWLSMIPFRLPAKDKNFIAWVGLRGAVPIILATYPRLAGIEQSDLIFNIVFFVVLTSILIQGTTISSAARLLKVIDPNKPQPNYPLELNPLQGWKGELREIIIPENSCVVGKAVFELGLPDDYLIVLLARDDEFIIPHGSLVFQEGDRMLGLATQETHQTVLTQFNTLTC